jgi:anti-anti-sigma factor
MSPVESLSVSVAHRGAERSARDGVAVVVWLSGEHDLSTVAELSEAMARAIAVGGADVVVDASEVEFMGAATVGVLRATWELLRSRSRSLTLRSPSSSTRRILELCGDMCLLDIRCADPLQVPGTADALATWVAIPVSVPGVDVVVPAVVGTTGVARAGTRER